ncbi:MAG TPA: lipocalin-like domain-containing protein [Nitrospiria bacterium]|jgi:predicted secreted hydrolase
MNKIFWIVFFSFLLLWSSPTFQTKASDPVFEKALPGYSFSFPADHGSHPSFQTEWWYYTGHLVTEDQREYGFELTFFRFGIDRSSSLENPSRWAVKEIYMAHFAISDIHQTEFFYGEKISREALGKAGAKVAQLSVWIDDWRVEEKKGFHVLVANQNLWGIDLKLASDKPPVIHGEKGVSQKGKKLGEASHYYSLTRMNIQGTLQKNGLKFPVKGTAWMDHEFSTHSMPEDLEGWDWFSIQLDNQWDLMIYQLRQKDGTPSPFSSGSLIDPQGNRVPLHPQDFQIHVLDHWKSPKNQGIYPMGWNVVLPGRKIDLTIIPFFKEQELSTPESTRVTYWEGAVKIKGNWKENPVTGRGYTELTGYAKKTNVPK